MLNRRQKGNRRYCNAKYLRLLQRLNFRTASGSRYTTGVGHFPNFPDYDKWRITLAWRYEGRQALLKTNANPVFIYVSVLLHGTAFSETISQVILNDPLICSKKIYGPLPAQPNREATNLKMDWSQHPKAPITAMVRFYAKYVQPCENALLHARLSQALQATTAWWLIYCRER